MTRPAARPRASPGSGCRACPAHGADDAAAVERGARQQVEHAEGDVDDAQPADTATTGRRSRVERHQRPQRRCRRRWRGWPAGRPRRSSPRPWGARGSRSRRAMPPSAHSSIDVVPTPKRGRRRRGRARGRGSRRRRRAPRRPPPPPTRSPSQAPRSTATSSALQWSLTAPASRPREIDPVSIGVRSRGPGCRGAWSEHDGRAVAAAGAPDAGAGERRAPVRYSPGTAVS